MARKDGAKFSASDIKQREEEAEPIRAIARHFGRALCFTIMAAIHPAGGPQEDELLKACDDAWSSLADKIIEFAEEG